MRILALDQALQTTGWAIFEDRKLVDCGKFIVEKKGSMAKRLHCIQQEIAKLLFDKEDGKIDFIVFEGIQNQSNNETFKKLAYVQAAIMLFCYQAMIDFSILAPSEWRKLNGGGYGKTRGEQKENAIEKVKQWYSLEVDSDTADAINIGRAYLNFLQSAF